MKKYLIFCLFFALCACAPKPIAPTDTAVPIAELSESKLKQGKNLYESECSCCHRLYPPIKYTHLEWKYNLSLMQKEAKITDDEKALVYEYLMSESNPN